MDEDKVAFLKDYGGLYGYPNSPKNIDEIRATEFKRLDGLVYLDHAGATLYSELQMESIFKDLTSNVYGNPHSQSDSSSATCDIVREARQQVLDYFKASPKDYKCIFTSGATAALKLVGEAFPWSSQSCFTYTMENHNSVLGIREYALDQGAAAFAIDIEESVHVSNGTITSMGVSQHHVQRRNDAKFLQHEPNGDAYNLFAFPSECNFSGLRFNLDMVKMIKEDSARILEGSPFCNGHWMVLIDAAKGSATEAPDLSLYPADFVVISFYKLFGYPTGLGALVVRNDAAIVLKKTYFSGGTVAATIADIDFVKRRKGIEELFEDGTISFLSIASISRGFKILNSLTTSAITRHTTSLAMYVRKVLLSLQHENGARVCSLYGAEASKVLCHDVGPIVSFNLKRPDGSWYGYHEVEKLASLSGIQLRTGCFCNPGACAKYLGLSHVDLLSNVEAGHVCWDDNDVVNGKPTGAVRISFGYMSTYEDAKKFVDFITRSFVTLPNQAPSFYKFKQEYNYTFTTFVIFGSSRQDFRSALKSSYKDNQKKGVPTRNQAIPSTTKMNLKSIVIYPIKSCAGFSVQSWPLSSTGLKYDREWVLTSLTGEILTQKKVPEMGFISSLVDLNLGILFVESPRCKVRLSVNLMSDSWKEEINIHGQSAKIETDPKILGIMSRSISCDDYGRALNALKTKSYEAQVYDDGVNTWFSSAIGRPCTLSRCFSSNHNLCLKNDKNTAMCKDMRGTLNFANEAQFLLISEESVADLNNRINIKEVQKGSQGTVAQVNPLRFRPNLVISGGEPYAEDGWRNLRIGHKYFTSLGGCNRCQMINIVHAAGLVQKSNEPLATLASYRRLKGKILFGILLKYDGSDEIQDDDLWLRVGEEVHPNCI